jgi:RHS repeat-associated protein
MPGRGGSGGPSSALVVAASGKTSGATAHAAASAPSSSSAGASSALLSVLGLGAGGSAAGGAGAPGGGMAATTISRNGAATALHSGSTAGGVGSSHAGLFVPDVSPSFELITLDANDGDVMVPGHDQLATPGGSVNLMAQVRDSATGTYTYSWNTSGLSDATSISGSSTSNLTFSWDTTIATAATESVTLTVTDPDSHVVSQTLDFSIPAGTGSAAGNTTWNNSTLNPGLLQASAPAFGSQNASVVEYTGALETSINLPSYNPNVPALSLNYDSLAANALPIIVAEHEITTGEAAPSEISAQLTFDGTAGSTEFYNTSGLQPGDIVQVGLQANATSLDTGVYPYTMTIAEIRSGTPTTFTYTGNATVENAAKDSTFSALGAGWTVSGLERLIPVTGGVILDEGSGSVALFSGSFGSGGGTYTSPAGTFSTLVLNSGGTSYTLTETDGTKLSFNSSGLETTSVDRNGLTTTFSYSGSELHTITDPFSKVTTFTYASSVLQSIEDPADRTTTFTESSGDLTAVEYPDDSTWDYAYDGSGRMTSVTEPSSAGEPTKTTTITYDSAERVGTITQPDSTTEEFSAAQTQGWTNSGTSGSPAPSVLLGEVGSTFKDSLGNVTSDEPDWRGMGLTVEDTDALGDVTTSDLNANGLPTVTIDPLNRITQDAYDDNGNITKVTYPDGTTTAYGSYNSFAEPSSVTDQMGRTTTDTYDAHGNLTVTENALDDVTTYTYSGTQPGMLIAQTAPAPAGDASYTLVSYQYDSQDRLTTTVNAVGDTTVNVFNSAGQITQSTDPSGMVNTYSYDEMNRETGETNAAGTDMAGTTTNVYDKGGNETSTTNPADETTTTTYDAMDRVSTVEDADLGITTYAYTEDGQLYTLKDPDSNITTYAYNAINEQTEVTSPSVNGASGESSTTEYDADGEVIETTDADGRQVTYSYNQQGDQTGETWLNGEDEAIYVATFTYDADGEMTGADNPNATETFTYDNGGDLETEATSGPGTGQPTLTLTYSYDPSGDITSVKDSLAGSGDTGQGVTTYSYDNALELTTIMQSIGGTAGPEVTMTYEPTGQVENVTDSIDNSGEYYRTTYTYDSAEDLTEIATGEGRINPHTVPTMAISANASYNADGESTGTVVDFEGTITTNSYSYDNDSQLTASSGASDDSYGYDANGNPNSTGFTTGTGNELKNSPGVTYTYDNDGNMITATTASGTTTYTYDYENRLTNVEIDGTVVATYTYDALGRRIGIEDSDTQTWTVYNGTSADANPYADFNSSGGLQTRYLDGLAVDQVLAGTNTSGNTSWYFTNQVGSVIAIASTTAGVEDEITYDPFGNIVTQTNATDAVRFGFAGMEYDSVTGLYYDHARYYDAAIGRFTSQDPMGFAAGDTNLYRYVGNDPTAVRDPSGQQPPSGVIEIPVTEPTDIYVPPDHLISIVGPPGSGEVTIIYPAPVTTHLRITPGRRGPIRVRITPLPGPIPAPPRRKPIAPRPNPKLWV